MRTRKRRAAPNPPKAEIIQRLDQLQAELQAHGTATVPLGPLLRACRHVLSLRHPEGTDETPVGHLAMLLNARGWAWSMDEQQLAAQLPGWTPPAPRIVAVQPRLFANLT